MQSFVSWLTSQSGVSLLVALIALIGVLVTTWWNNKAADKRRIEDQRAESERRAKDDRSRELERLQQLEHEERARQRRAVSDCVSGILSEARRTNIEMLEFQQSESRDMETTFEKWSISLETFYWTASAYLNACDLEITDELVSEHIESVWHQLEKEMDSLSEVKRIAGRGDIHSAYKYASDVNPVTSEVMVGLRQLTEIARFTLHDDLELHKSLVRLDDELDKQRRRDLKGS